MTPTVKLTPKGFAWLQKGHPWIYRSDLASDLSRLDGEIVAVQSSKGAMLGHAFASARSKIALRMITDSHTMPDRDFFRRLIVAARDRRCALFSPDTACRLVSAEGDRFPGLIVDHYAGHLSIQVLIPGVERLRPIIFDLLEEIFAPETMTLRCDLAVRELEGLEQEKVMIKGEPPTRVEVKEGPVRYLVDLWEGHKTGGYLDQAANHIAAGRLARGRALDAFTFNGLFALHLAPGCDEVIAVDASAPALERVEENVRLNGLTNLRTLKANVFDELARLEQAGERFDVIVLDPPPFAKGRKDADRARKGYKQINLRAMRMLTPGGRLLTYSCSYNVSAADFLAMLRDAAADARRQFQVLEQHGQAPDHPVLLNAPETNYLKGFVLEAL